MGIEAVFFTQIGSIIVFLVSLFAVYRLLVSSKDATIETLRQQIDFLNAKIKALADVAPDVLLVRHEKRAALLAQELEAAEKEKEPLINEIEVLKRKLAEPEFEIQPQALVNQLVADRAVLENHLSNALDNEEFVVYFQPKISIEGKLTGVETLIRWNDPRTGLVLPSRFIPLLEETGMIIKVGNWVIRQAVATYLRWCDAGFPAVRVAVNISQLQMRNRTFIDEISQAIRIDPRIAAGLELEITESVLMQDIEQNFSTLRSIRAMGVTIAIDDFGTGYSSFSYLARLPVDSLKIDESFVSGMTDKLDVDLVSAIIRLAHSLKLKVVAEGVETEQQSSLLRSLACDELQGNFFGKPVSLEAFESKYMSPSIKAV